MQGYTASKLLCNIKRCHSTDFITITVSHLLKYCLKIKKIVILNFGILLLCVTDDEYVERTEFINATHK